MKRSISFLTFLVVCTSVLSQAKLPSYYEVVKTFCSRYIPVEENENFTSFAKKKDGWYVLQVNRLQSDSVLEERLFYPTKQHGYTDLDAFYGKAENPDTDQLIEKFLSANGSISDWYCFERIPYYGYNGWFIDIINDFADKENLSDYEFDGLGRAYDYLASTYLWYQSGGLFPGADTLHRKLGRLEYPSTQRLIKFKETLDKGIEQFKKLSQRNPGYSTIVGNGTLKLFNEHLHAYNQLTMCGADELAKEYIDKASLPEPYVLQAKNYLNSCSQNAILFSFGDNDTYQLWYVQEKYHYRKDILIVNNSLLGLPVYIDMLKRKKLLHITIPGSYLKDEGSDAAYYKKEEKTTVPVKKTIPLKDFLNIVYKKKYPADFSQTVIYPTYPYQQVSLLLPGYAAKTIAFNPGKSYCLLNDIAILDITLNNISTRPVYFTSSGGLAFDSNLVREGIVHKLTGENTNSAVQKDKEAKGLQKFIAEKYVPVLSNDSGFICYDGDNSFIYMYYALLSYLDEKKDVANYKKWLDKLDHDLPSLTQVQLKTGIYLAYLYFRAWQYDKAEKIVEQYARWLEDAYNNPTALKGFYSKNAYTRELKNLQQLLEQNDKTNDYIDNLLEEVK